MISQPTPKTLSEFFETVYIPLKLLGSSPRTVYMYRCALRVIATYLGREPTLDDLSDEFVASLMAWKLQTLGHSPATVNDLRKRINALWNLAAKKGMVKQWPNTLKLREPVREPQAWTTEELAKLFGACRCVQGTISGTLAWRWWVALHWVLWESGERIGAVLQLKWTDYDPEGWLLVRAECRKGRTADKMFKLSGKATDALDAIRQPQRELIFPWDRHRQHLWRRYRRILRQAGLPEDRLSKFHRMRRSVASHYEAAGGNATDLLGHSSRDITKVYLDRRICKIPEAADVLPTFDPSRHQLPKDVRPIQEIVAEFYECHAAEHESNRKYWRQKRDRVTAVFQRGCFQFLGDLDAGRLLAAVNQIEASAVAGDDDQSKGKQERVAYRHLRDLCMFLEWIVSRVALPDGLLSILNEVKDHRAGVVNPYGEKRKDGAA